MKKVTEALILLFLVVHMSLSVFATEFSPTEEVKTLELSVISANVSGLPAFLSKYDRNVPDSQRILGKMLNESGYDIICVQEDFQYHSTFSAEMTNYPYKTYTSGGVPIGDGLIIFSKYPFYNVKRIAWNEYNGIFADGLDALTPKGFIHCTVDVDGVLIDLYNVHNDAYRTDADQLAKKSQLVQLTEYIKENSKGRPIIITGDTNLTFHTDPLADTYSILIEENGFTDCWIELKNNGNYMQSEDSQPLISSWYDKFGGHDWGRWDSVERLLYKNGDGLKFKPLHFEYTVYSDDASNKKALTDHRMMECIIEFDISEYEKPTDVALNEEKEPSFFYSITHSTAMLLRFLYNVLLGASQYLISITADSIFMKILLFWSLLCIIYGTARLSTSCKKQGVTKNYIHRRGVSWLVFGLLLLSLYLILLIFFANTSIKAGVLVLIVLSLAIPSIIVSVIRKRNTTLYSKKAR